MKQPLLSLLTGGILAIAMVASAPEASAQAVVTETTTTASAGTITEFAPATETLVIRSETAPAPLRYVVTKKTTYVDEAGAPVVIEKVTPGTPISVQYTQAGDRMVVSRVIVKKAVVAPATTVVTTPVAPPPTVQKKTTTTTTTRKLSDDEKDRLEDIRENKEERREERRERVKDIKENLDED